MKQIDKCVGLCCFLSPLKLSSQRHDEQDYVLRHVDACTSLDDPIQTIKSTRKEDPHHKWKLDASLSPMWTWGSSMSFGHVAHSCAAAGQLGVQTVSGKSRS